MDFESYYQTMPDEDLVSEFAREMKFLPEDAKRFIHSRERNAGRTKAIKVLARRAESRRAAEEHDAAVTRLVSQVR
jgi:hypothetical protein